MSVPAHGNVRTFLFADIRGYTRFTEEYGNEAAARLATKFAAIVEEGVEVRSGKLVQLRGDEALAVFESPRQALRCALDLQAMFSHETDADRDLPLHVGIGIESGEAVEVEDGYRGSALNVGARLSAVAHGGEVLSTLGTTRLAGQIPGLRYIDKGDMNLKGIEGSTRVMRIAWEDEKMSWLASLLAPRRRRASGRIRFGIATVLVAAVTAAVVVYLTAGEDPQVPGASANQTVTTGAGATTSPTQQTDAAEGLLASIVPAQLWQNCTPQAVADPGAEETAVCVTENDPKNPDRYQFSVFSDDKTLIKAYEAVRSSHQIARNQGTCSQFSWGGELAWEHGPGKPGGRKLCYFEGDDAVIVWFHQQFDQPDHRALLAVARESGRDHASLYHWWRPWHHLVGKVPD